MTQAANALGPRRDSCFQVRPLGGSRLRRSLLAVRIWRRVVVILLGAAAVACSNDSGGDEAASTSTTVEKTTISAAESTTTTVAIEKTFDISVSDFGEQMDAQMFLLMEGASTFPTDFVGNGVSVAASMTTSRRT